MNLSQAISVLELYAGGPGSGPNAPCPQCGPKGQDLSHKLESGDIVKTKAHVTMFNLKTGNNDKISPGTKATILNVLPKVGTGDQMVSVKIKGHDPEYMKLSDVELHKQGAVATVNPKTGEDPLYSRKWFRPTGGEWKKLDIQPVPKSQVITKFKTADGANVTWVKPHDEAAHDPKTLKDIASGSHFLKGKFELTNSVQGFQDRPGFDRVTKIYDTTGLPAKFQKGSNASVEVNTYYKKSAIKDVVINERNTTTYGQKVRGVLSFSYKNTAAAVGMLKTRYGITTKMTRLSKAKFGV